VRAAVDPERPGGRYASVLLWRAMVQERALPRAVRLPAQASWPRDVRRALPPGLAQTLAGVRSVAAVPDALTRYEQLRLRPAIAHVTTSERETASAYLAHAPNQSGREAVSPTAAARYALARSVLARCADRSCPALSSAAAASSRIVW
jgi:hypothetical protein